MNDIEHRLSNITSSFISSLKLYSLNILLLLKPFVYLKVRDSQCNCFWNKKQTLKIMDLNKNSFHLFERHLLAYYHMILKYILYYFILNIILIFLLIN